MKLSDLYEGTMGSPGTKSKALQLAKIMKKPIPKKDYSDVLSPIFSDDELFDAIEDAIRDDEDQEQDVRPMVIARLKEWLGNPKAFVVPWEKEATDIIRSIVGAK